MAARKKMDREDLERDEVAEAIERTRIRFMENWQAIVACTIVIAALFTAIMVMKRVRYNSRVQATQTIQEAHEALSGFTAIGTGGQPGDALIASIASLQSFIDGRPSSPDAHRALYLQGNCYYHLDQLDDAQRVYQKYLDSSTNDLDRARAEIALGNVQENRFYLENESGAGATALDSAIARYEAAERIAPKNSYLRADAMINRARVLELTYRDDEALAIYDQILEERPAPSLDAGNVGDGAVSSRSTNPANLLLGPIIERSKDSLNPLSFHATAQSRSDRIRAARELHQPRTEPLPVPVFAPEPSAATTDTVTLETPPDATTDTVSVELPEGLTIVPAVYNNSANDVIMTTPTFSIETEDAPTTEVAPQGD